MAERIVEVQWEDSGLSHGWRTDDDEIPKPRHARSVGYVLLDDEEGLTLTESLDVSEQDGSRYCCTTAIPRSAIRKVTELRPKRAK